LHLLPVLGFWSLTGSLSQRLWALAFWRQQDLPFFLQRKVRTKAIESTSAKSPIRSECFYRFALPLPERAHRRSCATTPHESEMVVKDPERRSQTAERVNGRREPEPARVLRMKAPVTMPRNLRQNLCCRSQSVEGTCRHRIPVECWTISTKGRHDVGRDFHAAIGSQRACVERNGAVEHVSVRIPSLQQPSRIQRKSKAALIGGARTNLLRRPISRPCEIS
jgi:hypothetical protein